MSSRETSLISSQLLILYFLGSNDNISSLTIYVLDDPNRRARGKRIHIYHSDKAIISSIRHKKHRVEE